MLSFFNKEYKEKKEIRIKKENADRKIRYENLSPVEYFFMGDNWNNSKDSRVL